MPYVEILGHGASSIGVLQPCGSTHVDPLVREAGWHGGALFLGFAQQNGKLLDRGHGEVASVVSGKERLLLHSTSV